MALNENQPTPHEYAERLYVMLHEVEVEIAADMNRVNDPKAKAVFEKVREILLGAEKELNDFAHQRKAV
jgi:hypothetical protein